MSKKIISTSQAPKAIGPYSQAVSIGSLLYTSGQLGINPENGTLQEGVLAQTNQAMENLGAILREANLDFSSIIKTTIFVKDMADFATVNGAYQSYFTSDYPARSCVQVAALPLNGLVEIEAIALIK